MANLVEQKKKVERNKRLLFMGVGGAGVALAVTGSGFLGLVGIGVGAYLGYDWFKYRLKNGMRF